MAFISLVFIFLFLIIIAFGIMEVVGIVLIIISLIRRTKLIHGKKRGIVGLIVGIILAAIPVVIVLGIIAIYMIGLHVTEDREYDVVTSKYDLIFCVMEEVNPGLYCYGYDEDGNFVKEDFTGNIPDIIMGKGKEYEKG